MPAPKAAYRITRTDKASIRFPDGLARVDAAVAPGLGLPQDGAIGRGFAQSIEHWPAYSVAALKRLKQRFKLVAMTNGQRWALEHMQRTLGNPFDDSITVDEALCDKAGPSLFRLRPRPSQPSAATETACTTSIISAWPGSSATPAARWNPSTPCPTITLRHWPNWSTQFNAGITEMKHSV
jgi:hypothetical protein